MSKAKQKDVLSLICEYELTVQVGRLDGTVVVMSNRNDSIYVSERYDDCSAQSAAMKALLRAIELSK